MSVNVCKCLYTYVCICLQMSVDVCKCLQMSVDVCVALCRSVQLCRFVYLCVCRSLGLSVRCCSPTTRRRIFYCSYAYKQNGCSCICIALKMCELTLCKVESAIAFEYLQIVHNSYVLCYFSNLSVYLTIFLSIYFISIYPFILPSV